MASTYSDYFQSIEDWGYVVTAPFINGAKQGRNVVVLAIDEETIKKHGAWPWSRTKLAKLVDKVSKSNPKTITLMLDLYNPQSPAKIKKKSSDSSKSKTTAKTKIKASTDVDKQLADSLKTSNNTVITSYISIANIPAKINYYLEKLAVYEESKLEGIKKILYRFAVAAPESNIWKIRLPLKIFRENAASIAFTQTSTKQKRLLYAPLLSNINQTLFPSPVLATYALVRGVPIKKVIANNQEYILIKRTKIHAGPNYQIFPTPIKNWEENPPIRILSAAKFLDNSKRYKIQQKSVFIGVTDSSLANTVKTATGAVIPKVNWYAYATQSLINNDYVQKPYWFYAIQRALILIFALYLLLTPKPLYGRIGYIITLVIVIATLNVELISLISQKLWLPLLYPSIFLLLTHTLVRLSFKKSRQIEKAQVEISQVRQELGSYYQSQSNLNQAFNQLRLCSNDGYLPKVLYNLGLDFERKRQFDKALEVYEHIHSNLGIVYNDTEARIERLKSVTGAFPATGPMGTASTQIMLLTDTNMEKPILGRYQLEREIGRGAMGMVYLGKDPKIARAVAIKTLALGSEYEGKALEEAEARFLREAEAVGRLNHPNIVTIYDVGEDQGVAYIAMDYVEGASLDHHMSEKTLLKIKTVVEIGAQVADALAYAHKKKVIHRDVKPANIIFNAKNKEVKVTDFGIAALTDDSKTRTGTILGSPSYMSPEQISGKKAAGASDQFSLGVTMYQLLTGHLPFDGDSMANLMYQITDQTHKPMRKMRRGIPPCISRIVNKTLQKSPDNRFANCDAVAEALRKCVESK